MVATMPRQPRNPAGLRLVTPDTEQPKIYGAELEAVARNLVELAEGLGIAAPLRQPAPLGETLNNLFALSNECTPRWILRGLYGR